LNEGVALYACGEGLSTIQTLTWDELLARVERLADALRESDLKKGDRVAAVISNCVEAIILCLATLSIGAIFSTCSPDMGTTAVTDRLKQIEPRYVFIESSVVYNGKRRPLMDKARACLKLFRTLPNFQEMIIIPRHGTKNETLSQGMVSWADINDRATGKPLTFEQLPFSHPGFIVYSSGTVRKFVKHEDIPANDSRDGNTKVYCSQCDG
jgi:acetoacetyl-CoA synthetase